MVKDFKLNYTLMKKLLLISALLIFACNKDGGGLYGPIPDPFDWDYDLGVFSGDIDMYIDGVFDSKYESVTMGVASSFQPDGSNDYCLSSNFVILGDFTDSRNMGNYSNAFYVGTFSCGMLEGEVFTINSTTYNISFWPEIWGEKYGGGTFSDNEIQIEFYEESGSPDTDGNLDITRVKMWTGTLNRVD